MPEESEDPEDQEIEDTEHLQVPIPRKMFFQLTDVLTRMDDLLEAGLKASNIQISLLQSIAETLRAPRAVPAVPGVPALPLVPGVPAVPPERVEEMISAMWIPGLHPPPLPGERLVQIAEATDAVTVIPAGEDKRIIELKGRRGVFRGAVALFDDENCGLRLVAQDLDTSHKFNVSTVYEAGLADAEYIGICQVPRYDTVNSRYSVTLLQPKLFLDKLQVYLFNTDTSSHNCRWYLVLYDYYEPG